jgi:glutamate N-acetyltransferase/amino-acid N-acetyltransferase
MGKEISGGVCAPKGFMAGGIKCGIKASGQKKDLALIYSETFCTAAGMFTQNKVRAACVQLTEDNVEDCKIRAIIANSGNANACTGQEGMEAALRMAKCAADSLLINPSEVAVASTGVIGVPLPVELIEKNIDALKSSLSADEKGHSAALEAIMTTDTRKKDIAVEIKIDGKTVRIGAMAKGSGMIHPNMATMLAFITTDASIMPSTLCSCLRRAVNRSFNRLTVDGDTSTNDMVIVLANGEAKNKHIDTGSKDYEIFSAALEEVCTALAKKMARDGEGATKLVTVTVKNAVSEVAAEILAKAVASSSLVKAACFGADANWGRVICALGYGAPASGIEYQPEKTDISFKSAAGEILVCKNGESVPFSEEDAKKILTEEEIEILVDLQDGRDEASVWGCDLTYDYVKINGDYRS